MFCASGATTISAPNPLRQPGNHVVLQSRCPSRIVRDASTVRATAYRVLRSRRRVTAKADQGPTGAGKMPAR